MAVSSRWLILLAIVAAILVGCTAWYALLPDDTSERTRWLLGSLNLSQENNLASWFAAMLLLGSGLLSYDAAAGRGGIDTRTERSWRLLSLLLIGLSIDEYSSIHERVELLAYGVPALLVPGAMLLLFSLAYCVIGFYRDPATRPVARGVLLASVLLATVPLQEEVGHRFATTPILAVISGGLEEATELTGSLILLAMTLRGCTAAPGQTRELPRFALVDAARPAILIVSIPLVPVLAYWTASLVDRFRGHPADWFTATLFLCCGLLAARRTWRYRRAISIAGLALFSTASIASVFPPAMALVSGSDLSRRATVVTFALLAAAALWRLKPGIHARHAMPLAVGALVYLAMYEAAGDSLVAMYLLSQAIALYAYAILASEIEERTAHG